MRRTAAAFALIAALLVLPAVAACGGDDDDDEFDDIRASATAAAQRSPGETPADGGDDEDYPAAARSAVDELNEALDQLNEDLTAAEASQADPKWPGILTADIEAVRTAGNAVKELEAPEEFADVAADLNEGVNEVLRGVDLLGNAIASASQQVGAEAVLAITQGTAAVNAAAAQLPQ